MDRQRAGALLALAACLVGSTAAPTTSNQTALDLYDESTEGCYYNFQHYGEGDRIMTNEPCLNCTCHNRMLMCYLRVCPFTKAIGQDCSVEKRADQCCPIVTCPDVPVDLLTSTSTTSPAEYGGTGVGKVDKYGCSINGKYFSEGAKVPPTPGKPCEHCYCIRNMTTCVMQECTLHVDGCTPIYHKDVCCPVRYYCDHPEEEMPLLDDMTTTVRPTPGFLLTTTAPTEEPTTTMQPARRDCIEDDQLYPDGALIKTDKPCEHCYCMKGDIVCVVQECGTPMENEGKNCTSLTPREGQCCPDTYICEGDETSTDIPTTEIFEESVTTLVPPRRVSVEGSGYRNEPDEIPYTEIPTFATELEGSGEDETRDKPEKETAENELVDEYGPTKETEFIPLTTQASISEQFEKSTTEPDKGLNTVPSDTEPSLQEKTTASDILTDASTFKQTEQDRETTTSSYESEKEKPSEPSIVEETAPTKTTELSTLEEQSTEGTIGLETDDQTPSEMNTTPIEDNITESPAMIEPGAQATKEPEQEVTIVSDTEKPFPDGMMSTNLPSFSEKDITEDSRRTASDVEFGTSAKPHEETEITEPSITENIKETDAITEPTIREQSTVSVSIKKEQTTEVPEFERTTKGDKSEVGEQEAKPFQKETSEPSHEKVTPQIPVEMPADKFTTITSKEEEETVTTEPTFKEDEDLESTTKSEAGIAKETAEPSNKETSTERSSTSQPEETGIKSTTAQVPEQHEVTTEPVMELSTFAHVSDKESAPTLETDTTATTPTDKIDLPHTTSINPADNEIAEVPSPGRIPGEGDCLLEGTTYQNESIVPSTNKCHSGCKCVSSIIKCDPIICSPPPEGMDNCQPRYDTPEACCPTYVCDHGMETIPPQPQSHITGTESPSPSTVECHGDECDKTSENLLPVIPTIKPEHADTGECGTNDCDQSVQRPAEPCADNKCETFLPPPEIEKPHDKSTEEVPQSCINPEDCKNVPTPCEGELCTSSDTITPPKTPQICTSDECKQVITPQLESVPCEGQSCTIPQPCVNPEDCKDVPAPCEGESCTPTDAVKPPEAPQECTSDECKQLITPPLEPVPCEGQSCTIIPQSCVNSEDCKDVPAPCEGEACISIDTTKPPEPPQECTSDECKQHITPQLEPVPCEGQSCTIIPQSCVNPEDCKDVPAPCEGESCTPIDTTKPPEAPQVCTGDECKQIVTPQLESVPCEGQSCTSTKEGCKADECKIDLPPEQQLPSQQGEICSGESGCKTPEIGLDCENGKCGQKEVDSTEIICSGDECMQQQPIAPTEETEPIESLSTAQPAVEQMTPQKPVLDEETQPATPASTTSLSEEAITASPTILSEPGQEITKPESPVSDEEELVTKAPEGFVTSLKPDSQSEVKVTETPQDKTTIAHEPVTELPLEYTTATIKTYETVKTEIPLMKETPESEFEVKSTEKQTDQPMDVTESYKVPIENTEIPEAETDKPEPSITKLEGTTSPELIEGEQKHTTPGPEPFVTEAEKETVQPEAESLVPETVTVKIFEASTNFPKINEVEIKTESPVSESSETENPEIPITHQTKPQENITELPKEESEQSSTSRPQPYYTDRETESTRRVEDMTQSTILIQTELPEFETSSASPDKTDYTPTEKILKEPETPATQTIESQFTSVVPEKEEITTAKVQAEVTVRPSDYETPEIPQHPVTEQGQPMEPPTNEQQTITELEITTIVPAETEGVEAGSQKTTVSEGVDISTTEPETPDMALTEKPVQDIETEVTGSPEITFTVKPEAPVGVTESQEVPDEVSEKKPTTESPVSEPENEETPESHLDKTSLPTSPPQMFDISPQETSTEKKLEDEMKTKVPEFYEEHVTDKVTAPVTSIPELSVQEQNTEPSEGQQTDAMPLSPEINEVTTAATKLHEDKQTEQPESTEPATTSVIETTALPAKEEKQKTPEQPMQTSRPEAEYSETTPYLVELEEHTHKIDEEEPTATPSDEPSVAPSDEPAVGSSVEPTLAPSDETTLAPSDERSDAPLDKSPSGPADELTVAPSAELLDEHTVSPSAELTVAPSEEPTVAPSDKPTVTSLDERTDAPSEVPTVAPSEEHIVAPSKEPTAVPSGEHTDAPSEEPTMGPSEESTIAPSEKPTVAPSEKPTVAPSEEPTVASSQESTIAPSEETTIAPSEEPTVAPSGEPTVASSEEPTVAPSDERTEVPSVKPTVPPADKQTAPPSEEPTVAPSEEPAVTPSEEPTFVPSYEATITPLQETTVPPSEELTIAPSYEPTVLPSEAPTIAPADERTRAPSVEPTVSPSQEPTISSSHEPTIAPLDEATISSSDEHTVPPSEELDIELTSKPAVTASDEHTASPSDKATVSPFDESSSVSTKEPTPVPSEELTTGPSEETSVRPAFTPSEEQLGSTNAPSKEESVAPTEDHTAPSIDVPTGAFPGESSVETEKPTTAEIESHVTEQQITEQAPSKEMHTELPEIETGKPSGQKQDYPLVTEEPHAEETSEKSTEAGPPSEEMHTELPKTETGKPFSPVEEAPLVTEEPFTEEAPEKSTEASVVKETLKPSDELLDKYGSPEKDIEKQTTPKSVEDELTTATQFMTKEPSSAEESDKEVTVKPQYVPVETTAPEEEFIPVTKATTAKVEEEAFTESPQIKPDEKPSELPPSITTTEITKPDEMQPVDEVPSPEDESHFPPSGGYNQEPDYVEEDQAFGPGTCRYGGKVYVSAQQIPRDDPCDFCFCFRSDIICLQQSCPPPIQGCHEEPIQGFCCPRYECPVSMATTLNVTTTTTTTTTTLPPHFLPHAYKGAAARKGCQIKGHTYQVGEVVRASSGPCLHCTCGGDGQMKCDPKQCTPEPMLRQMIAAAVSAKRRR